jgi:DNA-binding NarL/FixJ family response regulator
VQNTWEDFMNKSNKKTLTGKNEKNKLHQEYGEMIDMIESGMEDYEIADELGVSSGYVSDVKNKIYNDMV